MQEQDRKWESRNRTVERCLNDRSMTWSAHAHYISLSSRPSSCIAFHLSPRFLLILSAAQSRARTVPVLNVASSSPLSSTSLTPSNDQSFRRAKAMQPHWVDVDLLSPTRRQPAITQHAHNVASPLTCCSSSPENWRSASCFGWWSPPWQQLSLPPICSRCSVPYVSFTSAAPPLHGVLLGRSEPGATSPLMTDWLVICPSSFHPAVSLSMLCDTVWALRKCCCWAHVNSSSGHSPASSSSSL